PEWTRSDDLLDLLVRIRRGDPSGHDERRAGRRLAERVEHEAEGLLQLDDEALAVDRGHLAERGEEQASDGIFGAPALERGHAIFGGHRLAVVELEALA